MDILKGLVVLAGIIILMIIYGTINPVRNFLFILVFLALFGSLVGLVSVIIESINKASLKMQLPEKKAMYSYMLYVNFIALYVSELFLGKMSYGTLMYLVLALIFFYMSLKNYFFKTKQDDRIYDLFYTIIIALILAIVKTVIDAVPNLANIDISNICINMGITVSVIVLFAYGVKIVDQIHKSKQNGTNA